MKSPRIWRVIDLRQNQAVSPSRNTPPFRIAPQTTVTAWFLLRAIESCYARTAILSLHCFICEAVQRPSPRSARGLIPPSLSQLLGSTKALSRRTKKKREKKVQSIPSDRYVKERINFRSTLPPDTTSSLTRTPDSLSLWGLKSKVYASSVSSFEIQPSGLDERSDPKADRDTDAKG